VKDVSDIRSHRDLVAWQKAVDLGLEVYRVTKPFPESERFGPVSQARRASVSVASNIAEGYGRGTTSDYVRFLRHARGSLYEIDTQMMFAVRLGFLADEAYTALLERVNECGRILAALIRSLEKKAS
jgi:four helix bundle protein